MDKAEILRHVDHTLLKATASWDEIKQLCDEAVKYHTASVCVPPTYVARIKKAYPGLNVCTVIGFPLGYHTTANKVEETKQAVREGAGEVDMVINIGDVKNKDFDLVLTELKALREAAPSQVLKVIIETCYLTDDEKIKLCELVTEAKADYIKTSTGTASGGATLEDIRLFKKHIGPNVKIKAAGGIRTEADLVAFIQEGCERIGTSSAVKLLTTGTKEEGAY